MWGTVKHNQLNIEESHPKIPSTPKRGYVPVWGRIVKGLLYKGTERWILTRST
jgi:hypothetical protein